jgi:hypothetical protein
MKRILRMLAIASVGVGASAYADQGKMSDQLKEERDLSQVFFDFDSATLKSDLLMTANLLACDPDATIVLDGYADPTGSEEYNADLARRRAEAVRDRLVQHGIKKERIVLGVFGERGQDDKAPALARHVEIQTTDDAVAQVIESRKGTAVSVVTPAGKIEARATTPTNEEPQQQPQSEPDTEQ